MDSLSDLIQRPDCNHQQSRAPELYLQVHEGGQGLVDLQSRVAAFRLQAALETAVSQMFARETWHGFCYDGPVAPDWTGRSSC